MRADGLDGQGNHWKADVRRPASPRRFFRTGVDRADIDAPRYVRNLDPELRRASFHGGVAAEKLPFADGSFDVVVSQFGLDYLLADSGPVAAIRRCVASLDMGGDVVAARASRLLPGPDSRRSRSAPRGRLRGCICRHFCQICCFLAPRDAGMIIGMTKSKIAITLPPRLVAQARRAVRQKRADSVSAYVAAAVEEKAKLDYLNEMLTEMLAETGGPLTDRERTIADTALGVTPAARSRRAK